MPGHSVRPFHENLDFDLEIREGSLIHAEDASNRTVTTCHLVVREVGDKSGVKNSPMASTFPLTMSAELAASIFDASDCPLGHLPGCATTMLTPFESGSQALRANETPGHRAHREPAPHGEPTARARIL